MAGSIERKKITPKSFLAVTASVVKLLFIPHHGNNYRPHIIRNYGIVILLTAIVGMQLGYGYLTTGDVLGRQTDITINSLLNQTNAERAKSLEPALKLNDKLNQAAYLKVQDMFADQYWAHNSPDGTAPWKWFGDVSYNYNSAGENLAKNFTTTSAAMAAWMASDGHRANILNADYREVGFAMMDGELNGQPTSLVVALYGEPANGAVAGARTPVNGAELASPLGIFAQMGIAIRSMSPALLVGLGLVIIAMFVAFVSHGHRRKLPKFIRNTWRRHHGLYKGAGFVVLALVIIFISGGGQI